MAHSSKRKGNRYERELVADAEEVGLSGERAFASNGRAFGESEEVDNMIEDVRVQAKRRKSIANYLEPPEGCDVVAVRQDRDDTKYIVPKEFFLGLLLVRKMFIEEMGKFTDPGSEAIRRAVEDGPCAVHEAMREIHAEAE